MGYRFPIISFRLIPGQQRLRLDLSINMAGVLVAADRSRKIQVPSNGRRD